MTKRDESANARKRGKTGADFESELNLANQQYEHMKCAKIWPHSPPMVVVGKHADGSPKWTPKSGGGPIDRTGWASVRIEADAGPYGRDNGYRWTPARVYSENSRIIPLAFDAKVLGRQHATYQHEVGKQHQLHQLRDAANVGVFAFLLVLAPQLERVFVIPIENHFSDLISGRGVKLYDRETKTEGIRLGVTNRLADGAFPLLPSVGRESAQAFAGFNWLPLLQWCAPALYDSRPAARQ